MCARGIIIALDGGGAVPCGLDWLVGWWSLIASDGVVQRGFVVLHTGNDPNM